MAEIKEKKYALSNRLKFVTSRPWIHELGRASGTPFTFTDLKL